MSVLQRYTSALNSNNLKDDAHHHQTDVIAALAMSHGLGAKLVRLKFASTECNVASNYADVMAAFHQHVLAKSAADEWPSSVSPSAVARMALNYWLNNLCEVCNGVGHVVGVGEVQEECPGCNGDGKKALSCNRRLRRYIERMVESLDVMTKSAELQADFQLKGENGFG